MIRLSSSLQLQATNGGVWAGQLFHCPFVPRQEFSATETLLT